MPPVNLLLLNVTKRQRRSSNWIASSTRVGKGPAVESSERQENRCEISEFPPCAEATEPQRGHIGRETHAQQIDVVDHTVAMSHSHDVTGPATVREKRLDRIFESAVAEFAEKRISGSEREEIRGSAARRREPAEIGRSLFHRKCRLHQLR